MKWGELADKAAARDYFLQSGRDYAATVQRFDLDDGENTRRRLREWTVGNGIPVSQTPNYESMVLGVEGDALILSDLEIPDHDAEILELARRIAKKLKIPNLILNGDLLAFDGMSKFLSVLPRTTGTGNDIQTAKRVLTPLGKPFKRVYVLNGNHCLRIMWATHGELTLADLLADAIPDAEITPFSRIDLNSGGEEWLIAHPDNYSRVPGAVARDIAEIEHKNVVCGHTHHLSMSIDKSGTYTCIDGGHCRDERRTLYKVAKANRYPKWAAGFTVIRNGKPYLFGKSITDWAFWLG